MKEFFLKSILFAFCLVITFLAVRGLPGNPTPDEMNTDKWKDNGPLELSPERGRYALMYSLIEDKSFSFSLAVAKLATPDLGYKDGKYVSLFAPAVSFIAVPGYLIGKMLGSSQVGAFLVPGVFGAFNVLLIYSISKKIGASRLAGILAGLTFLFASPAFAYAVTLYQHHISTFSVLLSLWLLISFNNWISLFIIWFLCAMSIPIDYPNLFFMLPIGIAALGKIINLDKTVRDKIFVKLNVKYLTTLIGLILPIIFFMWFNYHSYGNALQFSGTVASVEHIGEDGVPKIPEVAETSDPSEVKKSSLGFFKTRELVDLGYIHLFSPDRGVLFYTPIILLAIIGIGILNKTNSKFTALLLSIVGFNIVLYAMFGEGGWAFGSRYLIPAYSVMTIFLSIALTRFNKNFVFLFLFIVLSVYSISVNTLGALTTSRIPPKVEAVGLEKITGKTEHYTYLRSYEFMKSGKLKSYVFQVWGNKYITAEKYYYFLSLVLIITILLTTFLLSKSKANEKKII